MKMRPGWLSNLYAAVIGDGNEEGREGMVCQLGPFIGLSTSMTSL
jgi:hypothetical protein